MRRAAGLLLVLLDGCRGPARRRLANRRWRRRRAGTRLRARGRGASPGVHRARRAAARHRVPVARARVRTVRPQPDHPAMARELRVLNGLAVALIAFMAGLEMNLAHLRPRLRADRACRRHHDGGRVVGRCSPALWAAWPLLPVPAGRGPGLAGLDRSRSSPRSSPASRPRSRSRCSPRSGRAARSASSRWRSWWLPISC